MELGAFSVSLAVKDLAASKEFYEKLGFTKMGGNPEHRYLILKNGETVIGLFQGMFEENILTFNPGWTQNCSELDTFADVRKVREHLVAAGLEVSELTGGDSGPASMMVTDPDGNTILIDQHR